MCVVARVVKASIPSCPGGTRLAWCHRRVQRRPTPLKDRSVPEPVLIRTNGTILAGFGCWRLALFDDPHEIDCIEYLLSDEEALRLIISHCLRSVGTESQGKAPKRVHECPPQSPPGARCGPGSPR